MKFPLLDLETTGLDAANGAIMEVSVLIVESDDLSVVASYSRPVKHVYESVYPLMNEWCRENHVKSGLLDECTMSDQARHLDTIQDEVSQLIYEHCGARATLVGNSIHWDRGWIERYMPALHKSLHYRMLDVSGLWEFLRIFHGIARPDNGPVEHRGIPDIRGSMKLIEQFRAIVKVNQ